MGEISTQDRLFGREDVRRSIVEALTGVDGGARGAVVIVGEPGVGKTSLVDAAASDLVDGRVVRAACLPMATLSVPFLPFRSIFRDLAGEQSSADFDGPAARTLDALDRVLEAATADVPVVLAIDDIQWADTSTLDALLYLMAAPADRAVGLVLTLRAAESGESRPVDTWLSHARRVPRCRVIELGPLDRAATTEQITHLLGAAPHQSLVEDVWTHTRGYPYLTALVLSGLDPHAPTLPALLPSGLVHAVLDRVRAVGDDVVSQLRVLALAGRALSAGELRAVEVAAGQTEMLEADLTAVLARADDAGITVATTDGRHWFRHPLTAEALARELSAPERRSWHRAFVRVGEGLGDGARFEEIARVADHAAETDSPHDAYRWTLAAVRAAMDAEAFEQATRLANRAVELRSFVADAAESESELRELHVRAAAFVGALEEEAEGLERLLELADPGDRARRSALKTRLVLVRASAVGHTEPMAEELAALLALTDDAPASPERAFALAVASLWSDDGAGTSDAAREAQEIAALSHDERARTWSLVAAVHAAILEGDSLAAETIAAAARASASAQRDGIAYNIVVQEAALLAGEELTAEYAEELRRHRRAARDALSHTYIAWLAVVEAINWFALGRWDECATALRVTIGAFPHRAVDLEVQVLGGRLAVRQGRLADAHGHFLLAAELAPASGGVPPGADFSVGRAELHLADGDVLLAAEELARAGAATSRAERVFLLPVVARVLADGADTLCGAAGAELASALEDFAPLLSAADAEPGAAGWQIAFAALQRAEMSRAHSERRADLWEEAADRCGDAGLLWEESYACRRAAESLLLENATDRASPARLLRRGLAIATRIGANPLVDSAVELARFARITVSEQSAPAPAGAATPTLPGLTPREAEIVMLIVEGSTYAEIARALFVSEKTVSSHMSNILRKTGATNRIDLARLATTRTSDPDSRLGFKTRN